MNDTFLGLPSAAYFSMSEVSIREKERKKSLDIFHWWPCCCAVRHAAVTKMRFPPHFFPPHPDDLFSKEFSLSMEKCADGKQVFFAAVGY